MIRRSYGPYERRERVVGQHKHIGKVLLRRALLVLVVEAQRFGRGKKQKTILLQN